MMTPPRGAEHRRISHLDLLTGRRFLHTRCRGCKSSVMLRLHTALSSPKQHTVAGQFLTYFRANHQFPRLSDFDLERFAGVGSGNRVEIAFITDDTILATSPAGQDTGIIGERLIGWLQPFSSQPGKGNFSRGPMHARVGGRVEPS